MQTLTMNDGRVIPQLGFGTFQLSDKEICKLSVAAAIGAGYRMIDTASCYLNEDAVADGIKLSGVPREELFLTTKLWLQHCTYEKAKIGLENSLKRLGTDYVDMLLIHWPYVDLKGTWRAMEEMVDEGKVRTIGVCNCRINDLKTILEDCRTKPAVNQIETHILNQHKAEREFQKDYDILTEAWAILGRAKPEILQHEVILKLAEKYGKTPAQITIRWGLQEGMIVIPRSSSVARIVENYRVWDFELEEADMALIRAADEAKRMVSRNDPDDPKAWERLNNMILDI